ncbi:hypothetical protein Naga_100026g33 [Nannochloropsis gaditana]|uniref:Uncharacterized protein n=1 Tax=Nannochloropsis gaditana TaxID=72520 RepID=W7UBM1_9STRA|nr:hypothetical protein Naga_100026g33 [Nannochloropsis gaditana]
MFKVENANSKVISFFNGVLSEEIRQNQRDCSSLSGRMHTIHEVNQYRWILLRSKAQLRKYAAWQAS